MGLADDRLYMIKRLKAVVVPELRAMGFKGSFPHFRRSRKGWDYLSFEFRHRYGGAFAVEVGRRKDGEAGEVPDNEMNAFWARTRERLGTIRSGEDHWFSYDDALIRFGKRRFERLLPQVLELIEAEAVPWWEGD